MAALSTRLLAYGGLVVVGIGLYVWSSPEPVTAAKKPAVKQGKAEEDWEFPADETSLKFGKPASELRNVFVPAVKGPSREAAAISKEDQMRVPASVADGESNWAYTGMAEVNGEKMALLENSAKHQSGFVKQGDTWKKSRVAKITMASITFVDKDGIEQTVLRFNANEAPKPKPEAEGGFQPVELGSALKGVIGGKIEIHPNSADIAASNGGKHP